MSDKGAGQAPGRNDLFDFWRQFYESNEQTWTKVVKDVITSQGYAESQGKMLENFLSLQKMMRDGMSAQLNNLNVPTRDDIARLGELVLSLEEKIDQVQDRLITMHDRIAGLESKIKQTTSRAATVERAARPSHNGEQNGAGKGKAAVRRSSRAPKSAAPS